MVSIELDAALPVPARPLRRPVVVRRLEGMCVTERECAVRVLSPVVVERLRALPELNLREVLGELGAPEELELKTPRCRRASFARVNSVGTKESASWWLLWIRTRIGGIAC